MKGSMGLLLALWLLCGTSYGQESQIEQREFVSTSLGGRTIYVAVYLPAGYDPESPPYRVYTFLNGAGGQTHNSNWPTLSPVLDDLIGTGQIDPMVVVFPGITGNVPGYQPLYFNQHIYRNSERNGPFEDAVMIDFMEWLYNSSGYNVSAERDMRAIGGFSDGGTGSTYLGIKHSDQFAAFISHNGGMALREYEDWVDDLILETPGEPPYTYDPGNGVISLIFFGQASAFSPNMVDPNYPTEFLDFPVDPYGIMIPSIFEDKWMALHDAATMIMDPEVYTDQMGIWFSSRTEDGLTYDFNTRFHEELDAMDPPHPHVFAEYPGGHYIGADAAEESLLWLHTQLASTSSVWWDEDGHRRPRSIILGRNFPNPFEVRTTVPFALGKGTNVDISVFNARGRMVKKLFRGYQTAGSYQIRFDASDLPNGVYLYQVTTDDGRMAAKMQVTR